MAKELLIDSVDLWGYTVPGSISFNDKIDQRSLFSFTLRAPVSSLSVEIGDPVVFQDGTTIYFRGTVDVITRNILGPHASHIDIAIQCTDLHQICDRLLSADIYQDKTIYEVVFDLFNKYLVPEGLLYGWIHGTDILVKSAVFPYQTLTQAFDALCNKTGYIWFINADRKFYFIERTTDNSLLNIDDTGDMRNIVIEENRDQYRNTQYIIEGKAATDEQTEYFTTDGNATSWSVAYPITTTPFITYDGIVALVGVRGTDEDMDFYWLAGDNTITSATKYPLGKEIKVIYYGSSNIVGIYQDVEEINSRKAKEGGTGRYIAVESHPELTDLEEISEIAQERISEYAKFGKKVSFETNNPGWIPGTIAQANLSSFDITIPSGVLISSVELTDTENTSTNTYTIEGTTAMSQITWEKFFRDWMVQKHVIVGTENDQITIRFDYEKTWTEAEFPNPFYKVTAGDELVPGPSGFNICEEDGDDIKYIEWYVADTATDRKFRVRQTRTATKITTITNLLFDEANVDISDIGFAGGYRASLTLGTGNDFGATEFIHTKTDQEVLQIVRRDYKWV